MSGIRSVKGPAKGLQQISGRLFIERTPQRHQVIPFLQQFHICGFYIVLFHTYQGIKLFFPAALSAGMTAEELILNGISKATDPGSGGRHMSNHFAKPEWHIENISSATGTHDLHAAGVARAMVYYDHKGVVITSHGESASSEGFVYEAINGASLERLPVIFVWQDNGYGISVPKKDQTAARKVADNFSGFKNLKIIHCNGKDVFDSMNARLRLVSMHC